MVIFDKNGKGAQVMFHPANDYNTRSYWVVSAGRNGTAVGWKHKEFKTKVSAVSWAKKFVAVKKLKPKKSKQIFVSSDYVNAYFRNKKPKMSDYI